MSQNIFEVIRDKNQRRGPGDEFKPGLHTYINPYSYMRARHHAELFSEFDTIDIDGISLVLLLRWFNVDIVSRRSFDMTSVAPELFELGVERDLKFYFIGSQGEDARIAVENIKEEYPNLHIVGARDGYLKDNGQKVMDEILATGADVVIAGMGTPLQERFLVKLKEAGFEGIGYTCGGMIRQTAKGYQYYPRWIDRFNLRWLYRIYDEPRLLKRYLFAYPLSFVMTFIDKVQSEKD